MAWRSWTRSTPGNDTMSTPKAPGALRRPQPRSRIMGRPVARREATYVWKTSNSGAPGAITRAHWLPLASARITLMASELGASHGQASPPFVHHLAFRGGTHVPIEL